MAVESPQVNVGFLTAAVDLRTYQFCIVKMSGSFGVTFCGDGEQGIGILQNKPNTGEAAVVCTSGVSKCKTGASVTAGNIISSAAAGVASPSTTATDWAIGIALESITLAATPTDDELFTCLVTGPFHAGNAS